MANWYVPFLRRMSKFSGDIKRIKWFNFNARYFDRDFTNQMTREVWVEKAEHLQEVLTDEVIDSAFSNWPEEIYAIQGKEIKSLLKQRRDKLVEFANGHYEELAKRIYIRGTEDADYFLIMRFKDSTRIEVYDSNKEGDMNQLFYNRTFYDRETYAIEIYGLDGRDNFIISGAGPSSIRCYLVGGDGKDQFRASGSANIGKIRAYDTHSRDKTEKIMYHRVDDEYNTYERKVFRYNYGIPLFQVGWNPDDGLILGGGVQFVRYGFKKEPFASRHSLQGAFFIGSKSFSASYLGEWKHVIGKAGIDLDALYQGKSYVENFFGFGNDSPMDVDDLDYYRINKRSIRIVPALTYGGDEGHTFRIKLGAQSHKVFDNDDRFIGNPENGLPDDVFEDRRFVVSGLQYGFSSFDDPINTHRGFRFNIEGGLEHEWEFSETHRFARASVAFYFQFRGLGNPVLATRVGGELHGGEYQYYQAARLGAHDNFRGMPKYRLNGDKMFYQNIDLRFPLVKWRSYYLPAQMGLILSFDHGRVWLDNEDSDTWHYSYGGGLWISPFQALLLSLSYNVSDIDQRFNVQLGFFF